MYLDQRSIDIAAKAAAEPGTLAVGNPGHRNSAEVELVLDPREDRRKLKISFHITAPEERAGYRYCSPLATPEVTGSGGKSVTVGAGESVEVEIGPNPVRNPVTVSWKPNRGASNVAVATALLSQ